MTDAIHIGRVRARYRIAGDAAEARGRLDRVLRRVLDEALETAVARLDVPDGEELCVRTLEAPARLSLLATDAAVAAEWSLAILDALRAAIASGRDVVRYRSRRDALRDVVRSAARGDLSRAWAWAQLGLWDGAVAGAAHAGEAIADALCALPDAAPAVVADVARGGALGALAVRVPARGWERVAAGALRAFGADARAAAHAEAGPGPSRLAPSQARAARIAGRIAARSPLAAAVASLDVAPGARTALLALAALDAEPEAVALDGAAVLAALERLAVPTGGERRAGQADAPGRRADGPPSPASGEPAPATPDGDAEPADPGPPEPRGAARTRAGGLLFLLHVVAELELHATLCAEDGPLAARPLRLALHALALALAPVAPRDPAALAFCGLAPGDDPPGEEAGAPSDAERAAVAAAAAAVAERLRVRLGREDEPARAVLLELCRRDAEVVADPGWLELRLALEDADVRVRRAGLDVDPGWLPWLGCVVRFVYA